MFSRLFNEYNSPVSVSLWAQKVCRIPGNCQGNVGISLCLESGHPLMFCLLGVRQWMSPSDQFF